MFKKGIYIKDITKQKKVDGFFLVRDKNNGITKNGKPYIALNLSDKTGFVKARIWDNAERLGALFSQGDIVRIKAFSIMYQGTLQLNISEIEKVITDENILSEFLPSSENDLDQCFADLLSYIETINNNNIRQLLEIIFNDNEIATSFKTAPAAKTIHHDYIGGLLEHTLNIARLSDDISKHYPDINRDTLIAGALLHDIGKIYELSYDKNFDYTDAGRLQGHIALGVEIVNSKLSSLPDFPKDLALVLKHMILSHHGQLEFGSPKRPKTLEALLLSHLDDLDAKMYGFSSFIKREKRPDSKWTSFHKLFDRYIFTESFMDDKNNNDISETEN